MIPPAPLLPKRTPPPPRLNLSREFAADPFDKRMRDSRQRHTPLGLCVEIWQWYRTHEAECGPAFAPIAASIRELIEREAPDHVEYLEGKP